MTAKSKARPGDSKLIMWVQSDNKNLKSIDLSKTDSGFSSIVEFNDKNSAQVEKAVGEWLIHNYSEDIYEK